MSSACYHQIWERSITCSTAIITMGPCSAMVTTGSKACILFTCMTHEQMKLIIVSQDHKEGSVRKAIMKLSLYCTFTIHYFFMAKM